METTDVKKDLLIEEKVAESAKLSSEQTEDLLATNVNYVTVSLKRGLKIQRSLNSIESSSVVLVQSREFDSALLLTLMTPYVYKK